MSGRWPPRVHLSLHSLSRHTMESRIYCLVFLLLHLCVSGFRSAEATIGRHHHDSNDIVNPAEHIAEEHKLLINCQNSDYRTYIKCLKREKRQQHHPLGNTRCLDECLDHNCTTSNCIRECHSHCKKRLIETYSKTVETSYDCTDSKCQETDNKTPNITTIININHFPPNTTDCSNSSTTTNGSKKNTDSNNPSSTGGDGGRGGNGSGGLTNGDTSNGRIVIPKIDITNVINNTVVQAGGSGSSDCNTCPGCNCANAYPPMQPIPQITIGIGGGSIGGCMYFMPWTCYPRYVPQQIDCSMCGNPFFRYRCDPGCYSDPNAIIRHNGHTFNNTAQNATQKAAQPIPSKRSW